ncbi:MAG: hypothetical protein OEY19_06560 [Gammaproteobacteria bacterium]|nr:hypothetical protein [Gammaproteobacteria bacterium]MDH5629494.1 hypothetical protein [Gammaproteobacteria bacterium]
MANRSYLYSTNIKPESETVPDGRILHGISEYNYDIPLIFKVLMSGNPTVCHSSIWNTEEKIALIGDYSSGVEKLKSFLEKIDNPEASQLINEALEFINRSENVQEYFILECGEIFEMEDEDMEKQATKLIDEIINNTDAEIKRILDKIKADGVPAKQSWLSRMIGNKPNEDNKAIQKRLFSLGLGNWSNILYYNFSDGN